MPIHFSLASPLCFNGSPPFLGPLPPQQTADWEPRGQTLLHRPFEVLVLNAVGIVNVLPAQRVAAFFIVLAAGPQRPNAAQLFATGADAADVERRRVELVRVRGEHVVAVRGRDPLLRARTKGEER